MKLASKVKQVLLFILGFNSRSLPLHTRLWVAYLEVKSRISIATRRKEHFSLTYPPDEIVLRELTGFKTIEELATHMRLREKPAFFFQVSTTESKENIIATLERTFPEVKKQTLVSAEQIITHIFDLLGSGPIKVTRDTNSEGGYKPVDWHVDFKSGYRWDVKTYFKDVQYGRIHNVDIKIPWELSRFQHLPTLGKAYWFSNDEKYAREFVDEINDWIDSNPAQYGVNWACTMDVAIRVVNWIWGFCFFKDSIEVSDKFLIKFLRSLYVHGKFIERNLERNLLGINSNHYLSDLVGLVYLGVMFPEFKEAKKWQDLGIKELVAELEKQVYSDGVDYEASISYHRLVTELFLSTALLSLKNNITLPDSYMTRLEKMIEFVMHYTKPDGTAPQIGDNDDGRLHILANYCNWNTADHRYLLSIGAVLFNRPDFKGTSGGFHEEAFWLLGEEGSRIFNELPDEKSTTPSVAYRDGGFYIMRTDSLYMIVDCIPADAKAPSGHRHNSRLSFDLFAYDKSFIVDPGAYLYTADKDMRNLFRSTAYHNTVAVDDTEQNRFDQNELFSMGQDAVTKVNRWQVTTEHDILDVGHNGYRRLKKPIIHVRHIFFNKIDGYWVMKDVLSGDHSHKFDLYIHFAPLEVELDNEFPLVVRTKTQGANLAIIPLETNGVSVEVLKGWVSYQYGVKVKAPVVKYFKSAQAPASFCNVLYPYQAETYIGDIIDKVGRLNLTELFGGAK